MQVAEQIGISQYLISDYETGRLHLSDEMLIRFATVLAASSDAILGIDGSHVNPPSLKHSGGHHADDISLEGQ